MRYYLIHENMFSGGYSEANDVMSNVTGEISDLQRIHWL